jgi:L-threonylcarbamoyladenylate synthase
VAYTTDSFDGEIVRLLKQGGIGLLPSDTIYGLSARAMDEKAAERLHKLKDRGADKPFILLVSDLKMLNMLSISEYLAKIAKPYWPGALSVIFPAAESPVWLHRGTNSLAVRLPDKPELRQLITRTGPLISTSANLSGKEPAVSFEEAKSIFGDNLDFYINAGKLDNPPSTLASIEDGQLKVIRQGAVKIKEKEM